MSIKAISHVWDNSKQEGGSLLVLLALADFANDKWVAFPSLETLSQKSRMTVRNVQRILSSLSKDGELKLLRAQGPKGCNLYIIQMGGDKLSGGGDICVPEMSSPPDDICVPEMSPNPSVTIKENHQEPYSASQGVTNCHQEKHEGKGNSKFIQFRDQWMKEFKTLFGVDYDFQGGGDGKAVSKLVSNGRTVEDLIVLAKAGWASKDRWIQSQCRKNISSFAACINQIATEGKSKTEVLDPYAKVSF